MARQTRPLTNTEVKAAKADDKPVVLYDGDGLELLIKPTSNAKLWRFRYYKPTTKKRAMMAFGAYPTVSLADARRMRDATRQLLANGIDPLANRENERLRDEMTKGNTFQKVSADWYEVKKSQPLAENTIKDIWRSLEKYVFPFIGTLPITQLTARHFITALEPIQASGKLETVKRVSQRINEVMDYAVNSGLIPANPAAKIRKAFQTPVKTHMPTIRPEALPGLMKTLSVASIELQTRLLIEWQLLTVTRPAEAAETRWSEINLTDNTWTIPTDRMKMRRPHLVPLSSQALNIIEKIRDITGNYPIMFPGRNDSRKTMSEASINQVFKRIGYTGKVTCHGFRHTMSTILHEQGYNTAWIETQLAHVDKNSIRGTYNHAQYLDGRREMLQWYADYMEALENGGNVVHGSFGKRA
ncbi:integrase [Pectobacterium carotovorum]|nr:integrase [Pectobacterium carotovorum]